MAAINVPDDKDSGGASVEAGVTKVADNEPPESQTSLPPREAGPVAPTDGPASEEAKNAAHAWSTETPLPVIQKLLTTNLTKTPQTRAVVEAAIRDAGCEGKFLPDCSEQEIRKVAYFFRLSN